MINAAALLLNDSNVLTKGVCNGAIRLLSDMTRVQVMIVLHIPK